LFVLLKHPPDSYLLIFTKTDLLTSGTGIALFTGLVKSAAIKRTMARILTTTIFLRITSMIYGIDGQSEK